MLFLFLNNTTIPDHYAGDKIHFTGVLLTATHTDVAILYFCIYKNGTTIPVQYTGVATTTNCHISEFSPS